MVGLSFSKFVQTVLHTINGHFKWEETTRIIRYKGHPIRDIFYLSEKLRDTTLLRLVCLDEIRYRLEYEVAASEMQGHLHSF